MFVAVGLAPALLRAACEIRMTTGEKHSRGTSGSPTEKEAKQAKPSNSPTQEAENQKAEEPKPSEREIKAALAARERLYGEKSGQGPEEGAPKLPSGPEPTAPIEVEYPSSDELHPVANADEQMQEALRAMADSDWQVATPGLVLLRQLTIHHSEKVWKNIDEVMALVLKALKSLRSSLSKTAIMSTADIFRAFTDRIEPHLNKGGTSKPAASLLYQLLLKGSSSEKRFVFEEARRTLEVMAQSLSPTLLLAHLIPYAEHKSPKVRGATALVLFSCAERLQAGDWEVLSTEQLLKLSGRLVSDNTPDARNAAKKLIVLLKTAYAKQVEGKENAQGSVTSKTSEEASQPLTEPAENKNEILAVPPTWEAQCQKCLGPSQAIAVLKAASTEE